MKEKEKYFAVIPIHGKSEVVEAEDLENLSVNIDRVLEKPEITFPFHNFREGITFIKGRKLKNPMANKNLKPQI
jgi:septin family protein